MYTPTKIDLQQYCLYLFCLEVISFITVALVCLMKLYKVRNKQVAGQKFA